MKRREFLAAGAAAAGLAMVPRGAFGAAWGDAPSGARDLLLGPGVRAERCLELFLFGGMPTFHSFYAVDGYGRADDPDPALRNTQYHLFEDQKRATWDACGDRSPWLVPFGADALGNTVHFTPIARALTDRPDILARTRVVVLRHDLLPHEIAIPYMLTGQRLGNPRMAGLGAHVQRYWSERSGRVVPYGYVLSPEVGASRYNLEAASAAGAHPGASRPLHVLTSIDTNVGELLGRQYLGEAERERVDRLLDDYARRSTGRYGDASGEPLRSAAIADHQFAVSSMIHAPDLQSVLRPELFATPPGSETCGVPNYQDLSAMTLGAAVSLLTHPTDPARYVNVVDGGNPGFEALAYDTHDDHLFRATQNLRHLLGSLCARINAPDEADPRKLDLDDTLILVNGEFGRTPYAQTAGGAGTDHFPQGFVALMIGGPAARGVVGAIGPDGHAVEHLTPPEYRAGVLAALGIYPFSAQSFAVGDIRGASDEADALAWLDASVIGRTP